MRIKMATGLLALVFGLLLLAGCAPSKQPLEEGARSFRPYLVAVSVADREASIGWYVDNLGFRLEDKRDFPEHRLRVAMLERRGFFLEIVELAGSVPPDRCVPGIDNPALLRGFGKLSFEVEDAAALAKKLKARGVRFQLEPGEGRELGSLSFIVLDPDGNWLQFEQPPEGGLIATPRRPHGGGRDAKMNEETIGTARMEEDGTIRLQLRATGDGGLLGDAEFLYPPGHPQYDSILQHVGGLQAGQEKPVPPWE